MSKNHRLRESRFGNSMLLVGFWTVGQLDSWTVIHPTTQVARLAMGTCL